MRFIQKLGAPCYQIPFKHYKTKSQAKVGDIVVEGNKIISLADYNKQNGMAIGIVAVEAKNTPDGTVRLVSLNYMSRDNLQKGNPDYEYIYYGGCYEDDEGDTQYTDFGLDGYKDFPNIMNPTTEELEDSIQSVKTWGYIPTDFLEGKPYPQNTTVKYYTTQLDKNYGWIPSLYSTNGSLNPLSQVTEVTLPGTTTTTELANPFTDFNGKENTAQILKVCNIVPEYRDYYDYEYDSEYKAPAAYACTQYNIGGLSWYLPAAGELSCMCTNLDVINKTRQALGYNPYDDSEYWTSTQWGSERAVYVYFGSGDVSDYSRDSSSCVLAFSAI